MTLAAILGFLMVGIALGLLGGGGGILAVPVLVYLLHLPLTTAVPLSLVVVGSSAAVGAFLRWRRGELRPRVVALFALCSVTAAWLAPRLGHDVPTAARFALSIVTMLAAAAVMWRRSRQQPASPQAASTTAAPRALVIVTMALIVGTLTGLIGVGGGFLIVPVLAGVLAMPMPIATANSLGIIVLNTAASWLGYQGAVTIDIALLLTILAASLAGMAVGTRIAPRFSSRSLARAFAVLLVCVSLFMAWREFAAPPS